MSRRSWTALVIILLAAGVARFAYIGSPVFLFDEYWHAQLSTGRGQFIDDLPRDVILEHRVPVTSLTDAPSPLSVWTGMKATTHPALFPFALRFWRMIFGSDDAAMRALPALCSVIAILFLFDAMRLLSGTRSALWAAGIMALAGPQIQIARELRGYGMLLMFAMGAAAALAHLEAIGINRRRIIALIVCTAGMMLTHYLAAGAGAAMGTYALLRLRGRTRIASVASLLGGLILFAILWLPQMIAQLPTLRSTGINDFLSETTPDHLAKSLQRFIKLPLALLFEAPSSVDYTQYGGVLILLLSPLLLKRRSDLTLWIIWLWVTTGLLLALDLKNGTKQLNWIRYTLIAGPAVYALLASALRDFGKLSIALPLASLLGCAIYLPSAYNEPRPMFDQLAREWNPMVSPEDIVIFYPQEGTPWYSGALYLGLSHDSRAFPKRFMLMTHPPDTATLQQLRSAHSIWLIAGSLPDDPTRMIPGTKVTRAANYPGLAICCELSVTSAPDPSAR